MSSFPVNPRGTKKSGINLGPILGIVLVLVVGGYFLYNMLPNAFSAVLPGASHGGVKGEWVGMVTYQADMMQSVKQPAALKLNFESTDMLSIIPTYKVTGELSVAGHSTPVTFTVPKMMTGHSIISLDGEVTDSTDPLLKGGMITGDVENGTMNFDLHAMASGSTATVTGNLKHGTDADYASTKQQIK